MFRQAVSAGRRRAVGAPSGLITKPYGRLSVNVSVASHVPRILRHTAPLTQRCINTAPDSSRGTENIGEEGDTTGYVYDENFEEGDSDEDDSDEDDNDEGDGDDELEFFDTSGYEENGMEISRPWKTLLEMPARASWRVSDPELPGHIADSKAKILKDSGRTLKQLRRAYRKVLATHSAMVMKRERERRSLVTNRPKSNDSESKATDDPVFYDVEPTLASLQFRLYPNYAVVTRVLDECRSLLGNNEWSPSRIVDFGIGCGSSSAAALDMFEKIEWIHGVDPSRSMQDCSRKLLEGMCDNKPSLQAQPPRITFSASLSEETKSSASGGGFDLALLTYTATELPDVTSTLAAAAMLFEKLQPNGIMVLIEPGTPDGFNTIRAVRNMLLDCCPPDDQEHDWPERCHVIAPCTHNGACPMVRHQRSISKAETIGAAKGGHDVDVSEGMEEVQALESKLDSWKRRNEQYVEFSSQDKVVSEVDFMNTSFCSFVQTMPRKGTQNKGEKFSYLVVQKRIFGEETASDSGSSFENARIPTLLAKTLESSLNDDGSIDELYKYSKSLEEKYLDSEQDELGLEFVAGDANRNAYGRIVQAPRKKKGHVLINYCTAPGRIVRAKITKSMAVAAPGLYSAARKSRWGGLWPDIIDEMFPQNDEPEADNKSA